MLIGLVGKARAGKDTVAEQLVKEQGFKQFSFAAPLKEFAVKHFHLAHEEVYGEKTPLSRRILQGLGDGCREEFGKYIWINKLFEMAENEEKVVISDVRYLNEAKEIKSRGGFLIRIVRKEGPEIEFGKDHPSEMEQDQIVSDVTIGNEDTVGALRTKAGDAFHLLEYSNNK